ncbi:transmembrane protein 115 [Latimeria chalumnae]|uniref:Transmembrane protein 115 n=1 Tax=Latimeria chalumnae TaxID=7897 RepID=H3B7K8_LATCH|nr:PREDICTED: transmembrane protein 115 [Latimeria chalumnae]|eukprot:XP_005992721.1 PREDICTED: transmembrane protein 115 [Latimeria chalumnae]
MNRYLPVARQHFLAALASTSVVVKSICATVVVLYLLSFLVNTVYGLGVTPGYLFPPNFWIWTLVTHAVTENHIWDVLISLGTVVVAGRFLEPLWGALELLIFFAVVSVSVGVLGGFSYLLTYIATFNLDYLFDVHIHGMLGFLGGVLVALKQTMGDTIVLKVPQVRMKVAPMLLLLILLILRLIAIVGSNMLASYGFGILSSWVYLRFYQKHSRGRGDMSDHFAFATFFPEILQPVVGVVANLVHSILVKVKICRKTVKRYDVGAPSSITISLPGTDPQDAERRRQIALKALNERLKRVEDHSAWPSLEEEDEEDAARADTPFLLETGQSGQEAAASRMGPNQESSFIQFDQAPSQP